MTEGMSSVRFVPAPRRCCARSRWAPRVAAAVVAARRGRRRPTSRAHDGRRPSWSRPGPRPQGRGRREADAPDQLGAERRRERRPHPHRGRRGHPDRRRPCRSPSTPEDDDDDGPAARGHRTPRSSRPPPHAPVLRDPAGLTNQVTVVARRPRRRWRRTASPPQQLVDAVDGPVADFWSEQSNGAIAVGVTAHPRLGDARGRLRRPDRACGTRSPRRSASCPARAGT